MKDFIDVVPFLRTYALWVQLLVLFWLLFTAALGGVLVLAPRKGIGETEVTIDALRVAHDTATGTLTLEVMARNPLSQAAQLVELKLAFYGERKPKGGLQSFASESATYLLADGPDAGKLMVGADQSDLRHKVKITYPYAGQDFVEMTIPLSQSIKKDETDRFLIRFETQRLPAKTHKNIEAVIRYNGEKLTKAHTTTIS